MIDPSTGEPLVPNRAPEPAVPCVRCGIMAEAGVEFCGTSPTTGECGGVICQECNKLAQTDLEKFFRFPKKEQ